MRKHLAVSLVLYGAVAFAAVDAPEVRYNNTAGRVEVAASGKIAFASPPEGLWSVACDWRDRWPAEWQHAKPREAARSGDWLILRGEVNVRGGVLLLEDAYRPAGRAIKAIRRFTWKGAAPAEKITLSVRFQALPSAARVLLPGILYNGNPSGAASQRVPVYTGQNGEEAIFEEHRYPMPFAFAEGKDRDGFWGAALHTLPSPVAFANLHDQWWSLGARALEGATELLLLSGPCAFNGRRSVVKSKAAGFNDYDLAWLTLKQGAVVEKTFFLEAFPVGREGAGFRHAVWSSIELFKPSALDTFPGIAEIVRDKYRTVKARWVKKENVAGFRKYPNRPFIVMGWSGQAEAVGYALPVLADVLKDPDAVSMATRSLDFLSGARFLENGFCSWYDYEKNEWLRKDEPVGQAQAMLGFVNAIRSGRKRRLDTSRWEAFLRKAGEVYAGRILQPNWRPASTAEAYFIAPLAGAFELLGDSRFRQAALNAAEHYGHRHLSMREPYWGGTLDARCEDKEGAFAAFQGFLAVYALTRDPRYLEWANHAADVVLSYLVVWDIDLPAGRLRDHGLHTRGWTVVSPQNQHIDAFGVLIAADIFRLGLANGNERLKQIALLMYRSCGQMIDPYGSQGEGLQQTNWSGAREQGNALSTFRGGYNEGWTVFWITAHFLNAAAQFSELGVPVSEKQ